MRLCGWLAGSARTGRHIDLRVEYRDETSWLFVLATLCPSGAHLAGDELILVSVTMWPSAGGKGWLFVNLSSGGGDGDNDGGSEPCSWFNSENGKVLQNKGDCGVWCDCGVQPGTDTSSKAELECRKFPERNGKLAKVCAVLSCKVKTSKVQWCAVYSSTGQCHAGWNNAVLFNALQFSAVHTVQQYSEWCNLVHCSAL